jgi:hypothetical protein
MKAKILPILFLFSGSLMAQIPSNGLVAFFPFSSDARDSSSNKTHGTTSNVNLTTDRYGNPNCAYEFKGLTNSYIEFPSTYVKNNRYTYSLWAKINVKPNSGSMAFALNIGSSGGDQSLNIANNFSGSFNGWLGGGYNTVAPHFDMQQSAPLSTSSWRHIVCVRDSNHARLYVDGILVDSMGKSTVVYPSYGSGTVKAFIGIRNNLSSPFNGKIDDVIIYNRALSKQEVDQLFTDKSTSIDGITVNKINFDIYPNPSHASFVVSLGNLNIDISGVKLKIINTLGQEMNLEYTEISESSFEVNHSLIPGVYFVQVCDSDGRVIGTEKLIVQ